ncbi:MAG: RDD family protein [Rhodanobacteraceae bacterium]
MQSAAVAGRQELPIHTDAPLLYAGFWRRVVAWFIDLLIVSVVACVLVLAFGTWLIVPWAMLGGAHGSATARLVDIAMLPFGCVVVWLYYAVCESSRWQATFGKLLLRLRVIDEYGARIDFARASGRFFGKFASTAVLCLGFLLAAWSVRKQALHDFMAYCCVVRRDGLIAWQEGQALQSGSNPALPAPTPRTAMPGWAIALLVILGTFFIAIPVFAILAAIGVPAYQGYAVRAEVSQGVELTARPRALIGEYIGLRGTLPGSNADLGLPRPEAIRARYVSSVRVANGKVVVTFGNQASPLIRGGHVVISPLGNATMLRWRCRSPDIDVRYLPRQCRD